MLVLESIVKLRYTFMHLLDSWHDTGFHCNIYPNLVWQSLIWKEWVIQQNVGDLFEDY